LLIERSKPLARLGHVRAGTEVLSIRGQVRARIRRVVGYCAKPGRRRRDVDDDPFTVLPTAS
jgi:hypothetical protein